MNASQSMLRALRGLGYVTLLLAVFEACSGDDTSTPRPPDGPASIVIAGIALGQGFVGDGGASSVLACDYTIGVNVQTTYWTLLAPARCGGALQCGQLRVSLWGGPDGGELLTLIAAGNGVALDVRPLLSATPPLQDGTFTIKVELVDDAGKTYIGVDGGNGSAEQEFYMKLPGACTSTDLPGGAGTSSAGAAGDGAAGDNAGGDSAGATGTAGAADVAGTAGAADVAGTAGAADDGADAGDTGGATGA